MSKKKKSDEKNVMIPGELIINDCFTDVEKFNAEAEGVQRVAKELGFDGVILADGRVGKLPGARRRRRRPN
jgi:hypothetical protein